MRHEVIISAARNGAYNPGKRAVLTFVDVFLTHNAGLQTTSLPHLNTGENTPDSRHVNIAIILCTLTLGMDVLVKDAWERGPTRKLSSLCP